MVARAQAPSIEKGEPRKDLIRSEVGEIPSDWTVVSACNVGKFRGGNGFPLDYQGKRAGLYPYFKVSDMSLKGNERHLGISNNYIDETDRQKIGAYVFPENSIVIAKVGAAIFLERKKILAQPSCLDNNLAGFWITDPKTHYAFVNHYFQSIRLGDLVSTTALPSLNGSVLGSIKLPLPPTSEEQEAIAEALSDVDALIESLEALIVKKQAIKQGAMKRLLTPQPEWLHYRLGDVAQLKARIGWQGLTTAEYLDSGDYHLVTGTDFKKGFIDWNHCHFVERERYDQDRYIQLRPNDVLVTKDGTIGKVAYIDSLPKPATLNSGVFVIRPLSNAFRPKFLYYLLMSSVFTDFLTKLSAGSTINHLYQKDFVGFSFHVPSTEQEQEEIATTLLDMDHEIQTLEEKLLKAQVVKQGMMQELLTGRVRLV